MPSLSYLAIKRTSLQGRVVTFIQQHTTLSRVICICLIAPLANFLLIAVQTPVLIGEKSSQQACVSCSQTKRGDAFQEPSVFPAKQPLSRNTSATTSNLLNEPQSINTINAQTLLPTRGYINLFPYGSCTWWANQRYFQLHGFYVPWRIQSNAWQWTNRAEDFGWQVSNYPVLGAIVDLQPGVQGASMVGHVAIVERILRNGDVIASNMNWGAYPWAVTYVKFKPGPGVTFLYLLIRLPIRLSTEIASEPDV